MANLLLKRLTNTIAMQRTLMVRYGCSLFDLQVLNEYPKSGGTWIGLLLADALQIPFPQNRHPPLRRCIMHGHYMRTTGIRKPVLVWRDGRDVMTSLYHHCYFKFHNDPRNHFNVDLYREKFPFSDYDDVRGNLPAFIEQQFQRPLTPSFNWQEFVDTWTQVSDRVDVFYEDFRKDTLTALTAALGLLDAEECNDQDLAAIIDRHSFESKKKREKVPVGGHSFIRRGAIAGWKDEFSPEALDVFDHYGGAALRTLGYPSGAELTTTLTSQDSEKENW